MCEDHAVYDESFTLIFFILSLAWVRQYSVCQIIYTTPTLHAHTLSHRAVCVRTFIARQQSKKKSAEYAEQSTIERNREIDTHQNIFKACEWQLYRCVYSGSARAFANAKRKTNEKYFGGEFASDLCVYIESHVLEFGCAVLGTQRIAIQMALSFSFSCDAHLLLADLVGHLFLANRCHGKRRK